MARAILKRLKESTLLTFFECCKSWGLTKEDYNYNVIDGTIKFKNGSSIYLKDLFLYPSDPEFDSLGSTEYTGAFIDEASEVSEKGKNILMSRIRYKLDEFNLIPKIFIASNPSKNFLYYEFYKPYRDNKLKPFRVFVPALATDNPFISKHYIENLKKLDKNSKERLLYGNWEYDNDPTRLFEYDSIIDLFTNTAERGTPYCTVDVAGRGRDKTVIIIWNGLFIEKIIIMDNISNTELDEILKQYNIQRSHCIVDEDGVGFGLVKDLPGVKGFVNNAQPLKKIKERLDDKYVRNYANLKAQCWFELAEYVNKGLIGIYKDIPIEIKTLLIEDLEQIKQKGMDKDTSLRIITKEEIKENIGRSTDIGDALMMRMFWEINPQKLTFAFA